MTTILVDEARKALRLAEADPGARDEAEAVAAIHRTTALYGSSATVQAVTAALHRADLVPLAAHGRRPRASFAAATE